MSSFSIGNPDFLLFRLLNANIANCISILCNLLLVFLVIKKSTLHLRPYKKVLITSIVVDLNYTIASILNDVLFFVADDSYYVVPIGNMPQLPEPWYFLGVCWMLFSTYLLFTTVPIQFIYRYNLIVRGSELSIAKFLGLLIVPVTCTLLYTIHFAFMIAPRETDVQVFGNFFLQMNWTDSIGKIPKFYATKLNVPAATRATVFATGMLTTAYATSGICAIMIALKFQKEFKNMSQAISTVQSQITKVLLIQTIVPLVVLIGPMMVHVLSFSNSNIGSIVAMMMFTWSPVCNPIVAIIVLTPYRRFIVGIFSTIIHKPGEMTLLSSSSSTRIGPAQNFSSIAQQNSNQVNAASISELSCPDLRRQNSATVVPKPIHQESFF
uniref:G-protein coupled receptors family 1 profile domain-containing protein n=1 Tax=Panagrellus redivivus TaxID=6233 RepID=A0A7E4UTM1_PANRE